MSSCRRAPVNSTLGITYPIRGSRRNLGARFKTFGLGLRVALRFLTTSPLALATPWRFSLQIAAPRGITCLCSRATDTMALMREGQRPNNQASGPRASERARPAASAGRTSRSFLSVNFGARYSPRRHIGARAKLVSSSVVTALPAVVMPNPLVEPTRNGIAPRCAHVHVAHRRAMPLRAAHRER